MIWSLLFVAMSILFFGLIHRLLGRVSGESKERIVAMGLRVQSDLERRVKAKSSKKKKRKRKEA